MKVLLVCLFSAASAEASFGALGWSKIHDSLDSLQLTGTGRNSGLAQGHKMLIERFLQQAAASGELKPTDKNILRDDVLPALSDLKSYMQNQKTEDDQTLAGLFSAFGLCEYPDKQDDATHRSDAMAAWAALVTCRIDEAVKYQTDETDCEAMDTFLGTVQSSMTQHCHYPDKENGKWGQSNIVPFGQKLTSGLSHIQSSHSTFNDHNSKCTAAARALHVKHQECETAETLLYDEWCRWASSRTRMCDHQSACHTNAESAYATEFARLSIEATSRIKGTKIIYRIECLIQELIDNDLSDQYNLTAWQSYCEDEVIAKQNSETNGTLNYFDIYYGIQRRNEPAEQVCDRNEPNPVPGDANWAEVRYEDECPANSLRCTTVMKDSSVACPVTSP